jgi:leucyl-tRNA synthetase
VARYGADSTRLYTLFAAPPDRDLDWQDQGVEGVSRFLGRLYRFVNDNPVKFAAGEIRTYDFNALPPNAKAIVRKLHQTIKRISDELGGRWHLNTSVAALMELLNACMAEQELFKNASPEIKAFRGEVQRTMILLLSPFAPYLAAELWTVVGEDASKLLRHPWPKFEAALAREDEVEIVVQINGKVKSRLTVVTDATEDQIKSVALADEKVKAAIEGRQLMKVIVVKGKLVNIVVK